MDKAEFDKFADEYTALHQNNIRYSGENPEYFAEYKIKDVAKLIRKLDMRPSGRVLDFGSGVGNSIPYFSKHIPQFRLTCADVSEKSLEIAGKRYPGLAEFSLVAGNELQFETDYFDIIFSACVFHHIPSSEHVSIFHQLYNSLAPGGVMIIFEHNPYNPLTVQAVNTCPFDENAVLINAQQLKSSICTAGFSKANHCYRIFFPRILKTFRKVEPLLTWLPFGAQYYVYSRKGK